MPVNKEFKYINADYGKDIATLSAEIRQHEADILYTNKTKAHHLERVYKLLDKALVIARNNQL